MPHSRPTSSLCHRQRPEAVSSSLLPDTDACKRGKENCPPDRNTTVNQPSTWVQPAFAPGAGGMMLMCNLLSRAAPA